MIPAQFPPFRRGAGGGAAEQRRSRRGQRRRRSGWRRVAAVVAAGVVAAGTVVGASPVEVPAQVAGSGGPVEITEAPPLNWGFKQTWLTYAGLPEAVSGGVQVSQPGTIEELSPYDLLWPFVSGSYDPATGTTELRYQGTARWTKYPVDQPPILGTPPPPGYDGPLDVDLLDVTMSDPVVRISPQGAFISVEAQSRQLDTWEILDTGRVDVVALDVTVVAPAVDGGVTTWTDIPAATTGDTFFVFANNYRRGQLVDRVDIVYTGPGGLPNLGEVWDPPGSTRLELAENVLVTDGITESWEEGWSNFWIDTERRLVHYRRSSGTGLDDYYVFSFDEMAVVSGPVTLGGDDRFASRSLSFIDSNTGRRFFRTSSGVRWVRFDTTTNLYEFGEVTGEFPFAGSRNGLAWDAVNERAFHIRRVIPAGVGELDFDDHEWVLDTYTEQPDGSWVHRAYELPPGGPGANAYRYNDDSIGARQGWNAKALAAADGSLVVLNRPNPDPDVVPAPATISAAVRITLDETTGTATVDDIGIEIPNNLGERFNWIIPGPNGQLTLARGLNTATKDLLGVQNLVITPDGTLTEEPFVLVTGQEQNASESFWFANDPNDGTTWIGTRESRRIVGVRDGRVIADQRIDVRNPDGGPLVIGPDGTVYLRTNDGSPDALGSPTSGWGRFVPAGFSPTVTTQPDSTTVTLPDGITPVTVELTATATGDPTPTVQWQRRLPGETGFTDIDTATTTTLTLQADATVNSAQYRAVFTNTAGALVSDTATLTVEAAPTVLEQPRSLTVAPGQDAQFAVTAAGSPPPDITWQYLDGDTWTDVTTAVAGFVVEGRFLEILAATAELDGTRLRAELTNPFGTVTTDEVTLTVGDDPGGPGPGEQRITLQVPGVIGPGELAWSISGDRNVDLGDTVDQGDRWAATGTLDPITLSDSRTGGPEWTVSGQVTTVTGGLPPSLLGWTPTIVTPGSGATAGAAVASGIDGGDGLAIVRTLASATASHPGGTTTLTADLDLQLPRDTPPGTYTATLTLTALS